MKIQFPAFCFPRGRAPRLSADSGDFENSGNDGKSGVGRAAVDENGNYFPGPDEWGTAFTSYSGRGLDAVYFLIKEQRGWVPAAFHRDEIGDIDIVYGKTEIGFEDKGGYGLAHIAKRRSIDWKIFADTIENGNIVQSGRHRINIIDGKAKIIIELEWKGQKNNWVVSAMGNDLTLTADSLLASNPTEAAKQGIAPKGIVNIGDIWDDVNSGNKKIKKIPGTDKNGLQRTKTEAADGRRSMKTGIIFPGQIIGESHIRLIRGKVLMPFLFCFKNKMVGSPVHFAETTSEILISFTEKLDKELMTRAVMDWHIFTNAILIGVE